MQGQRNHLLDHAIRNLHIPTARLREELVLVHGNEMYSDVDIVISHHLDKTVSISIENP